MSGPALKSFEIIFCVSKHHRLTSQSFMFFGPKWQQIPYHTQCLQDFASCNTLIHSSLMCAEVIWWVKSHELEVYCTLWGHYTRNLCQRVKIYSQLLFYAFLSLFYLFYNVSSVMLSGSYFVICVQVYRYIFCECSTYSKAFYSFHHEKILK